MTAYELMIKTNHHLIKGGDLTNNQRESIANQLMSARSTTAQAKGFYAGVKFNNNIDETGRRLYPIFYIPPYNNGKKLKTIMGQTPKTQILSANMYELEILRLLHIFSPSNNDVKCMVSETLERIKSTCFGNRDDGLGECFDASLVVLRFLATTAPMETKWISERVNNYINHANEKKRPWFSLWYYWLCLSEMPFELASPLIDKHKDVLTDLLFNKSYVMNSEQDKIIQPVRVCILRNIIAKYPEYDYIKNREPHISQKDGRLHFNSTKQKSSTYHEADN